MDFATDVFIPYACCCCLMFYCFNVFSIVAVLLIAQNKGSDQMRHQSAWLKVQRLNFVENTEIRSIKCECSASRLIYKGFNSHITCQV